MRSLQPIIIAVLDACVLYPMYLRDTLLRVAERRLYRACWSPDILEEVERNLALKIGPQSAAALIRVMREAFPEASVLDYEQFIGAMTNDIKDRHVVAAAVACGAQYIITDNLTDFPQDALAPWGIEAQSADAFLCHLLETQAGVVTQLLVEQAADYRRPPLDVQALLERLDKQVPRFAAAVRSIL